MDATQLNPDRLDRLPRPTNVGNASDSRADRNVCLPSLAAYTADNFVPPQVERAATRNIIYQPGFPNILMDLEPYSRHDPDVAAECQKRLRDLLSKPAALGHLRSLAAEVADHRADVVALGPGGQLFAFQTKWQAAADDAVQTAFMNIVTSANLPTDGNRRALPAYAVRPYPMRQCCLATPLASTPGGSRLSAELQELAWAIALTSATMRLTVTFSGDRRLYQDYKAGLLQLLDALLTSLLRMIVVLLTALAHQATGPAFLLVMLGSIRHYGHRGEPDHLALPALALMSNQQRGAVRLAA